MYRSVLLPLDGSPFGEHAIMLATTLAKRSGARLELVHVHAPNAEVVAWEPVTPFRYEGLEQSEREWDGDVLHNMQDYLVARASQCEAPTTCKVVSGPVITALEHEIAQANPDLVVMATHGRGGFSRAWLGSVADSLIRNIHRPILLVRSDDEEPVAAPTKFSHILIPLDGSALAESVVPHALQLGEGTDTRYTLLRVVPPAWSAPEVMSEPDSSSTQALKDRVHDARQYLSDVADVMSAQTVNVACEVVVGTAAAATILEFARGCNADVIAMATHGRGGLKRLLLGSVADKVLRGSSAPMLLYHPA